MSQAMTKPGPLAKYLPRLLPCPFCGEAPTIEPWHGGKPTKVMISCSGTFANGLFGDPSDVTCPVSPSVTGETPSEGIQHWNTRAPRYVGKAS